MLRFGSFYDLLFFLVLEAIPFHLSGDPHAQLKTGDEGDASAYRCVHCRLSTFQHKWDDVRLRLPNLLWQHILLGNHWRVLDPIAAVVVSFFIMKVAIKLLVPCVEDVYKRQSLYRNTKGFSE